MNTTILWFLLANIGFAVWWIFYRIFLHRDTFFSGKRYTLLMGMIFTLVYPVLNVASWMPVIQPIQRLSQTLSMTLPEITITADGVKTYSNLELWTMVYFSIIALLFVRVVYQFSKLLFIAVKNKSTLVNEQKVVCLPKGSAPFSFFGLVFLHPEDHSENDLKEILHHERTHVRQAHTLDVLFTELICTVFWINPFAWLLKYDLRENLEFLADKDVVHAGFDPKSYQYHLLRLSYQQSPIRMGNNFNVSQLKNRIEMMNKKRTSQVGLGKYFLTLPLFAVLLTVSYACKNKTEKDTKVQNVVAEAVVDTAKSLETEVAPPPPPPLKSSIKFTAQVITKELAPPPPPPVKSSIKFTAPVIADEKDTVVYGVEQMPQYPGGDAELLKYIKENLHYPPAAAETGVEGRTTIRFVVTKTGKISDIKIIRGLTKECDDEAIRVIKAMPIWKPGMNKGIPVNVYYTLPITYKLQK